MTSRIRLGRYLRAGLIIGDFAVLNLAYWLVCFFARVSPEFESKLVWLAINAAYVPSCLLFSHFHKERISFADRVMLRSFKSTAVFGLVLVGLLYVLSLSDVGWHSGIIFMALFYLLQTLWWIISHAFLKKIRRMGLNFKRVALVGANGSSVQLQRELQGDPGYGYRIIGVFDDNVQALRTFSDQYTAPLHKLRDFVRDNEIDQIFYTLEASESSGLRKVLEISDEMGIDFVYIPDINPMLRGHFHMGNVGSLPALIHSLTPLSRPLNAALKRSFDILISLPVCLLYPVWGLPIALGIKLTSKGPVFFRQKRTGIRGKDFTCLKFRTMKINAEADHLQATKNDPRKTRFGDLLRRTSLDELPQFFNVLAGQMSVVGPRPHMISQTVEYTRLIDKYMVRHAIKPGITGWAQINGYRGGTKHLWQMERRVQHDVWYIHHWNFFLDLKIILVTALGFLRKDKNAY